MSNDGFVSRLYRCYLKWCTRKALGRVDDAEGCYLDALEVDPNFVGALTNYGVLVTGKCLKWTVAKPSCPALNLFRACTLNVVEPVRSDYLHL